MFDSTCIKKYVLSLREAEKQIQNINKLYQNILKKMSNDPPSKSYHAGRTGCGGHMPDNSGMTVSTELCSKLLKFAWKTQQMMVFVIG